MRKNKIGKALLLALIISLLSINLWAVEPSFTSSYQTFPYNTFNVPTAEEKALDVHNVINGKLVMHLSTLTVNFGNSIFGGKLDNAVMTANISNNLNITYYDKNGVQRTGQVTYAVQPNFKEKTWGSNGFRSLVNGRVDLDGYDSCELRNSTLTVKIYLVTVQNDIQFLKDSEVTVEGPFGTFSFTAEDHASSGTATVVDYPILGKEETDIVGPGQTVIDTVYGDEPLAPPATYAIELSSNAINLTSAAASGTGEVVSTLAIKAKNLNGTDSVNITFSSANDFELVNDQVSATIPYNLYYAADSSKPVEANDPMAVSVTGTGQTTLTQVRADNLTVKLNPNGSLTSYPAGLYSDTITISISTDS